MDGPLTDDTIAYTYDALGRVAQRTINGAANSLSYAYDALGRVTTETNVLGTFTYGYQGVTSRLASVLYPNGQTSTYSYLPTLQDHRLQTIHHKYPGGATLSKFDYTYDPVGNILSSQQQADSDPATLWEYGYDPADQLTRAVQRTTGGTPTVLKRYAWGYDPAGNRLYEQVDDAVTGWTYDNLNRLVTQYGGGTLRFAGTVNEPATVTIQGQPATVSASGAFAGGAPVGTGTNLVTIQATDASGNTAMASYEVPVGATAKTFTFDANGNLTSDGVRTCEWDAVNQLLTASHSEWHVDFSYDGSRRRVRATKTSGTSLETISLIPCGRATCEARGLEGQVLSRLFRLGQTDGPGDARFLTLDSKDSAIDFSNAAANLLNRQSYLPWGRAQAAGSNEVEPGYAGLVAMFSIGLQFASRRAYAADLGRWLNEDPAGLIDGPNRYVYARNRPETMADPTGLFTIDPSCNRCIPKGNGPGDGNTPASHEIFDATMQACRGKVVSGIKPARLGSCVEQSCIYGRVVCRFAGDKACDSNPRMGGFTDTRMREVWKREANLCISNWPSHTTGANLARGVIHEWAHSCGWDHEPDHNVPPTM